MEKLFSLSEMKEFCTWYRKNGNNESVDLMIKKWIKLNNMKLYVKLYGI